MIMTASISRSRMPLFQKNYQYSINIRTLVPLKPLVSLICLLDACSARSHGDTQTKYSNPRCACVPRVKQVSTPCSLCLPQLYGSSYGQNRTLPLLLEAYYSNGSTRLCCNLHSLLLTNSVIFHTT